MRVYLASRKMWQKNLYCDLLRTRSMHWWSKTATILISWGDPKGEPVLLVHGRQDSVSTFIPLLEHLPDHYYYVGLDLPCNGWSDPYPVGLPLNRVSYIATLDLVVQHLGWKRFIYIGHSMGSNLGLFFNAVFPGKIKKLILLDPIPSLRNILVQTFPDYHKRFFKAFYDEYEKYKVDDRVYSRSKAVAAVMRARKFTESQAELVLDRNLNHIGGDKYKLSWDKRHKIMVPPKYSLQYYHQLFTLHLPPCIVVNASDNDMDYMEADQDARQLVADMKRVTKDFFFETVIGNHDVHITDPVNVSTHVKWFLDKNFGEKAKI